MRLFKLIPKYLDSDIWKSSTHRGPVFVRATDEGHARITAAHRFVGESQPELRDRGIVSTYSWYSPALVMCSEVRDQLKPGDDTPIVE
jgi:hypothetical protein